MSTRKCLRNRRVHRDKHRNASYNQRVSPSSLRSACLEAPAFGTFWRWLIALFGSTTKASIKILSLLVLFDLMLFIGTGTAAEIPDITFRLANNELYVSAIVRPDQKVVDELSDGLTKEFIFFIDLFRIWNIWPDEFILGEKIMTTLKSNPIKREYVATRVFGNISLRKRFQDLEAMVNWAMTLPEIKLTNVKELEAGTYFIKVTAESRIRKLPPVIGYLLFFVPDKDFSISKNSHTFEINTKETGNRQ